MRTIFDIIDVAGKKVGEREKVLHLGNILKRVVVSPRYWLFPEASGVKPAICEVFTGLFWCGQRGRGLLVWRGRSLGTWCNVEGG